MVTSKLQVTVEFRINQWQRAGLIAGAMWRAAIGRDYEAWLHEEVSKHIYISEPHIDA